MPRKIKLEESPYKEIYEKMYFQEGKTLKELEEFAKTKGENISFMAFHRWFKRLSLSREARRVAEKASKGIITLEEETDILANYVHMINEGLRKMLYDGTGEITVQKLPEAAKVMGEGRKILELISKIRKKITLTPKEQTMVILKKIKERKDIDVQKAQELIELLETL